MEQIIFTILRGFLLAWFITINEPVQDFIKKFIKKPINYLGGINYLTQTFNAALSCHKCLSFFITLGFSQNFYIATSAAILAFVFEKIINSFKTYI